MEESRVKPQDEPRSKRLAFAAKISLWLGLVCTVVLFFASFAVPDLWLTRDQKAQRRMNAGEYEAAAKLFSDPMRRGAALYRATDFERAAAEFGRSSSAEAAYNQGNSLVMLGKYEDAIDSYDKALRQRPDWKDAADNRRIAELRLERLTPPDDDAGGTDGQLEADEIVFDDRAKNSKNEQTVEVGTGEKMSDDELRAIWLRRVETQPKDFLRSKFAFQESRNGNREESP